jgi:hypothetical protein
MEGNKMKTANEIKVGQLAGLGYSVLRVKDLETFADGRVRSVVLCENKHADNKYVTWFAYSHPCGDRHYESGVYCQDYERAYGWYEMRGG